MAETDYDSLAKLRAALTSDDASARSDAYGAVLSNDIEPTDVLGEDPPAQALKDAGVIPEDGGGEGHLDVLKDIRDLLEAAHGGDSA